MKTHEMLSARDLTEPNKLISSGPGGPGTDSPKQYAISNNTVVFSSSHHQSFLGSAACLNYA